MKTIVGAKDIIKQILGLQKVDETINYRLFFYVKKEDVNGGVLLLNVLTYELLFLDTNEFSAIINNNCDFNQIKNELIKKWFLVPDDFNDTNLAIQVENIRCLSNKIYTKPRIKNFTILPTTDCNARCFYCFEHGVTKEYMTEKTAYDIVEYILKNKAEGKIILRWFGGEPLYNYKVIDLICAELKKHNVEFVSDITTNGYIFDEELVDKALHLWNTYAVQISLDGTEEVYNRTKNYIYNDGINPFFKVLNNINLLLDIGIKVNIRMNMHKNNAEDIEVLTTQLIERFSKYDNVVIYPALLIEEAYTEKASTFEEKKALSEKNQKILESLMNLGKYRMSKRFYNPKPGHCMADDNTAVVISPTGMLGKCESIVGSKFWGSIYSDDIDFNVLNWYKEIKTVSEECDTCQYRPLCIYPKCCINARKTCDDFYKQSIENGLSKQMITFYNRFSETNMK